MATGWLNAPAYPLASAKGKTKDEAIANIKEAIELYIEVLTEEGRAIPEDNQETVLVDV